MNRKPKHGDRRVIKRFAWLPTRMSCRTVKVWLEWYVVKQEWYRGGWVDGPGWCDMKLLTTHGGRSIDDV